MEEESIDDFCIALEKLIVTCGYDKPDRSMVRDRFIAGLKDARLQEKLQFKSDLTLTSALDMAHREW